jgi:hypothetical protein
VRAPGAVCAAADRANMNASVNSIFTQSQVHSAGGVAPEQNVERKDRRGREYMRERRHARIQPRVRRHRNGASRALRWRERWA